MTQSGILYNALTSLGAMYDRLATHASNPIENTIQQGLQKQVSDLVAQANNASLTLGNSLALYFDSKRAVDQNALLGDLFASIGAIGPLLHAQNDAIDNYHNAAGTLQEPALLETAKQSITDLDNALKGVSIKLLSIQKVMQQGMLDIREEMKKFEYR